MLYFSSDRVCPAIDICEDDGFGDKVLFTFAENFSKYFNHMMGQRGREILTLIDDHYIDIVMKSGHFIPDEYNEVFVFWRDKLNMPRKETPI